MGLYEKMKNLWVVFEDEFIILKVRFKKKRLRRKQTFQIVPKYAFCQLPVTSFKSQKATFII